MKKAIMEKIQLPIMLVSTSVMFFRSKITLDLNRFTNEWIKLCYISETEIVALGLTVEPSILDFTSILVSTKDNVSSDGFGSPEGHHTMEFFEMCAALITQLAR